MTDDHIRQLTLERAQLIDLLMEARAHLSGATAHLDILVATHPWRTGTAAKSAEIKAFLEAGLFGDRAVTNQGEREPTNG